MALPTTIVSAAGVQGHHPPFKSSGGAFYIITKTSAGIIDAYKATDPTDTWAIQDDTNNPDHSAGAGDIFHISSIQDGDLIHLAYYHGTELSKALRYINFNMATDAWLTSGESIDTLTNDPTELWSSIAVRSDGDVIVVYNGDTDQVMGGKKERVDVNVRTAGGGWGGAVALEADGNADEHYGNPNCVLGTSDNIHIMWLHTAATADPPTSWTDVEARTIDSGDTLTTIVTDTLDTTGALLGSQNVASYDDGGTQRMVFHGATSASDRVYWPTIEDGSDDVAFGTSVIDTDTNEVFAPDSNNEVAATTIVELDGDLHQLFSGGGTAGVDQDLYYTKSTDDGASWSTPTEEIDAITVNLISANIYVRGADTVMAYVYDDGGVQKYNEKVLSLPGAISATVAKVFGAPSADLKAKGKLDATAALIFGAPTVDLEGRGKLDATSALLFASPSADLKAKGKLDAAAALVFGAPTVNLEGRGKLDATSALLFASPSADLKAKGKLDATSALIFGAPVVNLVDAPGSGAILATAPLILSFPVADLTAKGKLDASIALLFAAASADLNAKGKLDATAPLILSFPTADLNAKGKLDATSALLFASPSADLKAKGKLDAAAALAFGAPSVNLIDASGGAVSATSALLFASPSADLNAKGKLDATSALLFASPSADLNAKGKLDATSALLFASPSADLTGRGKLDATSALLFAAASADLNAKGKLDAMSALLFASPSADLNARGKLDATSALLFGVPVVNLVDASGGAIFATAALVFAAPSADLTARGSLSSSVSMSFNIVASLGDASITVFPFVGRHVGPFMLKFMDDLVS